MRIMVGNRVLHKEVLHANASTAVLFAGTDQTSHLSTAVNGDLNNTHPSIEATGFVVIMFNLVHGL